MTITAAIAGIGQTRYTKRGGHASLSELFLACEAIRNAVDDAGLSTRDIDGIATFSDDGASPGLLQVALGMPELCFAATASGGGGGNSCGAVALAAMAVASGQARCVVVYRAISQAIKRYGRAAASRTGSLMAAFGLYAPPQMLALTVRRHMHEWGTTPDQMARVALICRANAMRNPHAIMQARPLTLEMCREAPLISDPLRLYDCCLESDGACAVVVTSLERARDMRHLPVRIAAAEQGSGPRWGGGAISSHNMPLPDYASSNSRMLARRLYARAGLAPQDLDVAQIYENFTGAVLMSLEDFGICEIGAGGPFVEEGHADWPNGRLPICTAGGNLSEAYIQGLNHVVEGVRQIRGTSTSQVANAKTCLVTGGQGVSPTSALILTC